MTAVDVHQHLWPEAVLRVLERSPSSPRVRWRGGRWHVELEGEPPFEIDPADHDPAERADALDVDQAILSLSSPVGAEALPQSDALAAVAAWHEAAIDLPASLGWWSAIPAALPGAEQAEMAREALAEGAAGVCLPADRLAGPTEAESALPLLEAVAAQNATVFVHPGRHLAATRDDAPAWWAPATGYVAQQHAAWHAFHAVIRPALPLLRAIFALLAGLAPLHAERTLRRGGARFDGAVEDPLVFYDTSSYGPRAVRAMVMAVGTAQLVHGTDLPSTPPAPDPVAEALGDGFAGLVRTDGAARALGREWVPA